MNDQLLIDRSLINRIHATAKQGQVNRTHGSAVRCCKAIQELCLEVLQNAFENGSHAVATPNEVAE